MVRAIMIVEMAGRPPEHVKDTLTKHINVLGKFKDVTVNQIKVSEPKEIEKSNGLFTCFAEADFETETFGRLSETVFDFMPSSIEVLEPSKLTFSTQEATSLLNNIAGRMHRYDELARIAQYKMKQMASQLPQLPQNSEDKPQETASPEKKSKKKK